MDRKNLKDGFYAMPNETMSSQEIYLLLYILTNNYYTFAALSSAYRRKTGESKTQNEYADGFYQLMPKNDDEGFFNWYIEEREFYQFFETKQDCVLYFIFYWTHWVKIGKPMSNAMKAYNAEKRKDEEADLRLN